MSFLPVRRSGDWQARIGCRAQNRTHNAVSKMCSLLEDQNRSSDVVQVGENRSLREDMELRILCLR